MRRWIVKPLLPICFCVICLISNAQTTIQMEDIGGVYKIPCTVNGLRLKMIFDPGASNVCISESVAIMMLENDYLSVDDILGTTQGRVADGRIIDHTVIVLKEIKIGDKKLFNVEAVVIKGQNAPLLFGQSALRKLGRYTISGDKLILATSQNMENTELSEEELDRLLEEADKAYNDESYYVAIEKYKILYDNHWLNACGIFWYASCYDHIFKKEEALELYLSIQKEIESDFPNLKAFLYSSIALCYVWPEIDNCEAAIPYFEMAKYYATPWSDIQKNNHNMLLSCLKETGNEAEAITTRYSYIKKYLSYKGLVTTDCWDKKIVDAFLADLLMDIARESYDKYMTSNDDWFRGRDYWYNRYKELLIIAAAWGQKNAIKKCNELGLDYSTKPTNDIFNF